MFVGSSALLYDNCLSVCGCRMWCYRELGDGNRKDLIETGNKSEGKLTKQQGLGSGPGWPDPSIITVTDEPFAAKNRPLIILWPTPLTCG